MDNYEKVLNKLSMKYGLPIDVIKKITGSQFELSRQTIKNLDIDAIEEEEDLEGKNFRFMGLGDLYLNLKQLKRIRQIVNKKNDGDTGNTN